MKVYKIKHKPTGLFFTPSKGSGNLSKNGKIYPKKPRLEWALGSIRIVLRIWSDRKPQKHQQTIIDYFGIAKDTRGGYWVDQYFESKLEDWEIIEL